MGVCVSVSLSVCGCMCECFVELTRSDCYKCLETSECLFVLGRVHI